MRIKPEASSRGPLFDHLDEIEKRCLQGNLTIQEIIEIFGSDGHLVLIIFFIIPFLQPIPLPGLSTPFGILIVIVAVLAHLNKPPWIFKKWLRRKISAKAVSRIAEGSERIFEKLSRWFRPRMKFLFQNPFRTLNTFIIVLNAILLALPLPIPLSNSIPAWTIAFQALAHLEEDGLIILLSYAANVLCLVYFFMIVKGIEFGIRWMGF